ncbi:putative HAD-hydrolase YfnB [compost metagenome]
MNKITGIIFDMDNTLLCSKIDFIGMKKETFHFLVTRGLLPVELNLTNHTTSTLIEEAVRTNQLTEELLEELWAIPKKYEVSGMQNAKLESGVIELLEQLKGKYRLVVVTNNALEAAEAALKDNNIYDYFDCIVGREMVGALKPLPDGFLYILNRYNSTSSKDWISVGDSWIDGKASAEAGIQFISYHGDILKMNSMGVFPSAELMDIRELLQYV